MRLCVALILSTVATCCLAVTPDVVGKSFRATDSIKPPDESEADAQKCLDGLFWTPEAFDVRCESSKEWRYDVLVRFRSAVQTGDAVNDSVALEWHAARNPKGDVITAPAVLVVHESGRKMVVGKTISMLLSRHGVHAFMIHLPGYGERRNEAALEANMNLVRMTEQSIVDVRRARDAIVTLPMIEGERVALQGTSLGGFISSTAASLDDAFDSVFLMLCGGDLYDVLQNGQRDAERMRRRLASQGFEGESLKELLNSIEPLRVAHRMDPHRTWLFSGRFDTVVPLSNAKLLAERIGLPPEHHLVYDADHYSGVVHMPEMIERICREVGRTDEYEENSAASPNPNSGTRSGGEVPDTAPSTATE